MKRLYILFLLAVMACACQKGPVESICGSYSFKIGGYLEILGKIPVIEESGIVTKDTVVNSSVLPESGQMRILPKSGNEVVVTMNVTGGNPLVFNGTVEDDGIVLSPSGRKISLFNELSIVDAPVDALVSVGGRGTLYGGTLVFDLVYEGEFEARGIPFKIQSSKINCVATRNE